MSAYVVEKEVIQYIIEAAKEEYPEDCKEAVK